MPVWKKGRGGKNNCQTHGCGTKWQSFLPFLFSLLQTLKWLYPTQYTSAQQSSAYFIIIAIFLCSSHKINCVLTYCTPQEKIKTMRPVTMRLLTIKSRPILQWPHGWMGIVLCNELIKSSSKSQSNILWDTQFHCRLQYNFCDSTAQPSESLSLIEFNHKWKLTDKVSSSEQCSGETQYNNIHKSNPIVMVVVVYSITFGCLSV